MSKQDNFFEKGFFVATLLLLTTIPLGYFLSSTAFVLWFVFCIVWGVKTNHFKIKQQLIPLLIFSLLCFISVLWSQDQPRTVNALSRQLPLLLFPIAGFVIPSVSKKEFEQMFMRFCYLVCVFGAVMFVLAFIKYYKYQYKPFLFYHELVSPLKLNAIYMSYIVSVCLLFKLQKLRNNIGDYVVLLFLGGFLIMLASKMILSITLLIIVFIVVSRLPKNYQKVIAIGGIALALSLIIGFVEPVKKRFLREFNTSFSEILNKESFEKGRVYTGLESRLLQVRAFKEVVNTPKEYILGFGLSASKNKLKEVHKNLNTPEIYQTYNFHNQYLQIFAEVGLIGLILLLLVLKNGFKKANQVKLFLPFIILTTALFLSESVIWRQRGIMFFGLLYLLLFLIEPKDESKKQVRKV